MTSVYSQYPVGINSCTVCGTICDDCDNICLNCNSWKCLICHNKNNSIQYFRSDEELRSHLLTHTEIVETTPATIASQAAEKFKKKQAILPAAKKIKKEENSTADEGVTLHSA